MSDAGTAEGGTISAEDAAKLLMLESTRRIQQLAEQGYINRAQRGRYYTVSVVQGYIRFLKEVQKNAATNTSENRARDARARHYEIQNAKAEHQLIELTEAEAVIDEIAGLLKREIDGLASAITRDLPLRKKIQHHVDSVFERATARIAETLAALGASGEIVEADAEADS